MLKMSRRLCCLSAESTRARFYSANKICYAVFFVADYGDDPMDVPGTIHIAIWLVALEHYDQRGTFDNHVSIESAELRPYRIEGPLFRFAKGLELPELLV
jgi:hypothetical protein